MKISNKIIYPLDMRYNLQDYYNSKQIRFYYPLFELI